MFTEGLNDLLTAQPADPQAYFRERLGGRDNGHNSFGEAIRQASDAASHEHDEDHLHDAVGWNPSEWLKALRVLDHISAAVFQPVGAGSKIDFMKALARVGTRSDVLALLRGGRRPA